MKRMALMLGLTLAVGIALGVIAGQGLHAQQAPAQKPLLVQTPLQTDVVGMEGKEVVVQVSEFAPRARTANTPTPATR